MEENSQLRERIRHAVESGALPARQPDSVWGGFTTGAICALCGVATACGAVELELEFVVDAARVTYLTHPQCYEVFSSMVGLSAPQSPTE